MHVAAPCRRFNIVVPHSCSGRTTRLRRTGRDISTGSKRNANHSQSQYAQAGSGSAFARRPAALRIEHLEGAAEAEQSVLI
jgi:hypothetical protein